MKTPKEILEDYKNYDNPRFPGTFRWDTDALLGLIEYVLKLKEE